GSARREEGGLDGRGRRSELRGGPGPHRGAGRSPRSPQGQALPPRSGRPAAGGNRTGGGEVQGGAPDRYRRAPLPAPGEPPLDGRGGQEALLRGGGGRAFPLPG